MSELWQSSLSKLQSQFESLGGIHAAMQERRWPEGTHPPVDSPSPAQRANYACAMAPLVAPPVITVANDGMALGEAFYHRWLSFSSDSSMDSFHAAAGQAWLVVADTPLAKAYMPYRGDVCGGMSFDPYVLWTTLVFHLAWATIPGTPLRAKRQITERIGGGTYGIDFAQWEALQQGGIQLASEGGIRLSGESIPYTDWIRSIDNPPNAVTSELQNIADASVWAIDLLSHLAQQPAEQAIYPDVQGNPPAVQAETPAAGGYCSPADIAKAIGNKGAAEAIRKLLWRKMDENQLPGTAWMENSNPANGQAKILYSLPAVRPLLARYERSTPK